MELKGRQLIIFTSLYISYTLYVYVRRSVAFSIPALVTSEGFEKSQIGLITSSQSIAYAISKFICGILADVVSPKALNSGGLILSGITAISFTGFNSTLVLCFWWFLNGLSQGAGWPASAVILKQWCPPTIFGTVWSILSTSMNIAGTFGPLITATFIASIGWRESLRLAGMVSILIGFITFVLIKDKPAQNQDVKKNTKKEETESISRWKILRLPGFLGVCLCYMTVSLIQYGIIQWGQLYLVEDIGLSLLIGSGFVSSVEVGGIVGSFIAGYSSDYMISKNSNIPQFLVRKTLWIYFFIVLGVALYSFITVIDKDSSKMLISLIGFIIGFSIYGPISIAGVIALESSPKSISGTTYAVASLFSNVGIFLAGLPFSYIAKQYDLQTTFFILGTFSIIIFLYLIFKLKNELSSYRGGLMKVLFMK
ncbi:glucose-6-phosphate exchanger SLC37A4-like isoform X1 [Mytilus trossulus]|uniref:glucose-6-phosphate exchanger SLC37A4-like isoform X1 n=1 Tax=Mytilus trossulus TaxID=6551 RepID=UPI0030060544